MPTYRLRCSYTLTDGRHGSAFDEIGIEAAHDADAIARAKAASKAPPNMRSVSAILSAPDGRLIWSLQANPDARYPFARAGVEPFEG